MENQVDVQLAGVRAVMDEQLSEIRLGSTRSTLVTDMVGEQLEILSTIKGGTSDSDHERVEIKLIALEIVTVMGGDASKLIREIWLGGDASPSQWLQVIRIRLRPRRAY